MLKKSSPFILNIAPLIRLPLTHSQSFSYLSPEKIPEGALVSIPFFHREVEGIVLECKKDFPKLENIKLKKIRKILEKNFLTSQQIKLAHFISDYYFVSLGIALKNFVPKRVKSRKPTTLKIENQQTKKIKLTEKQKKAVETIAQKKRGYLLFGPAGSGKTEVYIHSILKIKKRSPLSQFLILVPEQTLTLQAIERYGQYFKPEEIVLLTSHLSKGQYYLNWLKIKQGKAKIIIGTRMAVFAPFKKLGLIIVDEEQDISFKQWDMSPRYDARTIVEELSVLHKSAFVYGSATPRLKDCWRAKNKYLKLLRLPFLDWKNLTTFTTQAKFPAYQAPKTILVDMRKERWAKNYTSLSKKLQSEISYALKNKQQTILLVNRQGMSAFSICKECRTVLKCPHCSSALIYDQEGYYKCPHCGYKTGITPKCAQCGGINFENIGLGTQKVKKEITDLFPSAKVVLADSSKTRQRHFQDKLYADFSAGKIDILVGTQMISKGWDLPRLALTSIIDLDNLLSFPDFSAGERVFQTIIQISGRVNRPGAKFPGRVILQTFQPENKIIKLAIEKDYLSFYKNEMKERKVLNLPPYGKLIKLIYQHYNQEKVTEESLKVYKDLAKIPHIRVTEPHNPLLYKIRGRFRKQIIIKVKSKKNLELLKKTLKKTDHGWIIDVDPISTT